MGMDKKNMFLQWSEVGTLDEHLMDISMLIMQGRSKKDIAKVYKVTLTEVTFLINQYPDFKKAFDPENNELMVRCFKSLRKLAFGFRDKRTTKDVYKDKKGNDKVHYTEAEVIFPPDRPSLVYLLSKFYGPEWEENAESLKITQKKLEMVEEWSNADGTNNHNQED